MQPVCRRLSISSTGRTLVERAVDGLLESGVVDHVVVAVPADRTDRAKLILGSDATVVAGGANRGDSVSRALAAVTDGGNPTSCWCTTPLAR